MKRNWDTIRDILGRLEDNDNETITLSHFPNDQHAEVSYHMELLIEAGIVNGQMSDEFGSEPVNFFVSRLSWDGHEFLDSIKNDTVWEKTKKTFFSKGVSMTFDLIKTVASEISASYIKSIIGV